MNRVRPQPSKTKFASANALTDFWSIRSGFRPEDIIFDPNILTVATGMGGAQQLRG